MVGFWNTLKYFEKHMSKVEIGNLHWKTLRCHILKLILISIHEVEAKVVQVRHLASPPFAFKMDAQIPLYRNTRHALSFRGGKKEELHIPSWMDCMKKALNMLEKSHARSYGGITNIIVDPHLYDFPFWTILALIYFWAYSKRPHNQL